MPRVLVVDDDPGVVATLTDALTLKGYTVTVASDGPEALEQVKEAWPHVVLLDVKLPTMNGLEVLLCIRSFAPAVEVVMMSGLHDEGTIQTALILGARDYLMKPIRLHDLERSVKDCLTRLPSVSSVPLEQEHSYPQAGSPRPKRVRPGLDPGIRDEARLPPLLRPFSADELTADPLSTQVNHPANDTPGCNEPFRGQG